jgi:hypothetical protein
MAVVFFYAPPGRIIVGITSSVATFKISGPEVMQKAGKYVLNGITILTAILITTNSSLAQTTIDGGAKPYFIAGGAIAATFFISVGAILFRKGNRYLRIATAAAQWPTVTGKVVSSDVVTRIDRTEDGPITCFIPQVHYVYDADGVSRDGSVIQPGLENRGYSLEQQAREHVARYSVGSSVPVRYDPRDPANVVLELGQIGGGSNLLAGILLMLVGIGGVAFTVFSIVTPSN